MAYSYTPLGPTIEFIGGKKYYSWIIEETDVGASDEYEIEDVPTFCTLTLFEARITSGTDTIQPELWTDPSEELGEVVRTCEAASALIRNQDHVRITTTTTSSGTPNKFVGRSKPAGGGIDVITRITVVEGH